MGTVIFVTLMSAQVRAKLKYKTDLIQILFSPYSIEISVPVS